MAAGLAAALPRARGIWSRADGSLPEIQPGVLMDGDDLGKWLQQQKQPATWARLLPEQQERLVRVGHQAV
ncbi:helicase associated domain-containing protein [Streptomyces sp. CA-179760]|uniref:helicase associated domain-containing protein n=1 Tax=Streptomyces sp. CA-179760 TaxID=3240054 RepID=UPI003D8E4170